MSAKRLKPGGTRRHGMSEAPEYGVWSNMRGRCANERHPAYGNYGGRGITVCERWDASFEAFFADMGPRPSPNHTLERVDNDQGYEQGNCRWATVREQQRNRRNNRLVMCDGRLMPLAEACALKGVNLNTAYARAVAGRSDEDILSQTAIPQPKRGPRRS